MNQNETPEQKAKRLGVPVIPEKKAWPVNPDPNRVMAVCGKCGLELRTVMGYVCTQQNCPTGLGGAVSLSEKDDANKLATMQFVVSKMGG